MFPISRLFTLACVAAFAFAPCYADEPQSQQEHVHHAGHEVMGFDMSKTLHVFKMTETGGTQRVVLRENVTAAPDQVAMIRMHLQHEADEFQHGRYADPAKLHGATMPGLMDMQANASSITVSYTELPNGAELVFATNNPHALTAIHRWFDSQLSEHGADAKAE